VDGFASCERARGARGFFTTIRRLPSGGLTAVPYSVEYQAELTEAARLAARGGGGHHPADPQVHSWKNAPGCSSVTTTTKSDIAWMELDATIEPTVGPYEVYEDEWFNFQKPRSRPSSWSRTRMRPASSARFQPRVAGARGSSADRREIRNPKLGGFSPIRVADVVFLLRGW